MQIFFLPIIDDSIQYLKSIIWQGIVLTEIPKRGQKMNYFRLNFPCLEF